MPHLDGPGLYEALKAMKPQLLNRVVFATGDLLNAETERFLKQSGRPCIEKPFMPAQIRQLAEEIAEQNAKSRQDRKAGVEGRSESVGFDSGGHRTIKKKK